MRKDLPTFGAPANMYVPFWSRPSMTGSLLSYTVSYSSVIVTVGRNAGSFIRRNFRYSSCKFSLLSAPGFAILLLRIFGMHCPASAPTDAEGAAFSFITCSASKGITSRVPVYPGYQLVLRHQLPLPDLQRRGVRGIEQLIRTGSGYSQRFSQHPGVQDIG